jgi:hypothetical protein
MVVASVRDFFAGGYGFTVELISDVSMVDPVFASDSTAVGLSLRRCFAPAVGALLGFVSKWLVPRDAASDRRRTWIWRRKTTEGLIAFQVFL